MRFLWVYLFFFLSLFNRVSAQETAVGTKIPEFYKLLTADSVVLYYDHKRLLVSSECAVFYRYTKLSPDHDFTGQFKDFNRDGSLLATGVYLNKKRQGLFQLYYPNGQLKETGFYSNDLRQGRWTTYYENGVPQYILDYGDKMVSVLEAWKNDGTHTVMNGNGMVNETMLGGHMTGTVKNGFMQDKWTVYGSNGIIIIEEIFKKGKITKGSFPLVPEPSKSYENWSRLPFLAQYHFEWTGNFKLNQACKPYRALRDLQPPTYHQISYMPADHLAIRISKTKFVQDVFRKGATLKMNFNIDKTGEVQEVTFAADNDTAPEEVRKIVQSSLKEFGRWQPALRNNAPVDIQMDLIFEITQKGIQAEYYPTAVAQK